MVLAAVRRLTRRARGVDGRGLAAPDVASATAVLLGAALVVLAAQQQPYNQNEWVQIRPYGDPDLGTAVSGTRQPPLDPLLGVLVQRLLGVGHLEQRLVPVAAGIGSLAVVAVLLRRLGLGWAAPLGVLFLATAPLFLRYSAYTRPYALPVLLMLLCALAGSLWLDTGRRRWLAAALATALLLPVARVPEPTVFLTGAAGVLAVLGARDRGLRARAWALAGTLLLGLLTVGAGMLVQLAATSSTNAGRSFLDPDPERVLARVPAGLVEIWDLVVPLYSTWFPWWPLTVAVVLTGVLLPTPRRRLLATWYWAPLLLGPLAFLVAFHTLVPLDLRDYRIRFAYFAVPPLAVLVAVVAHGVGDGVGRDPGHPAPRWRWWGAVLVLSLVVSQLPASWRVLTRDDAVDLAQAGQVLAQEVPDDAVVVFDGPAPIGRWRQPFFARSRFLPEDTTVLETPDLARGRVEVPPGAGPVYLLLVDAECVSSVACDLPSIAWQGRVEGYRPVVRMDHLTLYEPVAGQEGREGLLRAMRALVSAYGAQHAVLNAQVAARILDQQDRRGDAFQLLARVCRRHPDDDTQQRCRRNVARAFPGRGLRGSG